MEREIVDVSLHFPCSKYLVLNFLTILIGWHYHKLLFQVTDLLLFYSFGLGLLLFGGPFAQQEAYIKSFTVLLTKRGVEPLANRLYVMIHLPGICSIEDQCLPSSQQNAAKVMWCVRLQVCDYIRVTSSCYSLLPPSLSLSLAVRKQSTMNFTTTRNWLMSTPCEPRKNILSFSNLQMDSIPDQYFECRWVRH